MSNRYRNPFKIRATEKLESENNFLRMYSPYVLEELVEKNKTGKLWNNVLFIHSSPGAGKTSILKVFEPASLLTLSNNKSAPDYVDLIEYLKKLEVIDGNGNIHLAGAYLSCARNYDIIEDLEISEGQKKGLFFALINARVVLASLRSIVNLNGNVDLSEILLTASSYDYAYLDISFPINGSQLFEWAANIEKMVYKAIDSFLPITNIIQGHSELFGFDLMQPSNITIQGRQVVDKFLFMFDDVHKLSRNQRNSFLDYLIVRRANYNVWIAERLEALDEERNFGSYKNRDYDEINLEEIWQGSNKLKTILASIADKRASMSSEDVRSFQFFLEDSIKETEYEDKFIKAYEKSLKNITSFANYSHKFDKWISYVQEQAATLSPFQLAVHSRQIEILINRSAGKAQLSFEFPLEVEELKQKLGGEIQTAALFFISIENKIPFYYGFDNLVKLSTNNIEQFLSFAAELFEIMLARKISDKSVSIDAGEQEKILRKIADNKWKEQIRLLPYSDKVLKFLMNLATFCQKETYKPNAPYAPGPIGFTIKDDAEHRLIKEVSWREDRSYAVLINVLRTCLAYNLLEKRTTKQGKENQQWTVYYLNRWICLRFNLPFSYGNFRHKSPTELLNWTK